MLRYVLSFCCLLFAFSALASDESASVKQKIVKQIPEMVDAVVTATPIPGVYSVQQGSFIFYTSADANYVFRGQLLSLSDKRNLTEDAVKQFRKEVFHDLQDKDTIIYLPEGGKFTHTITVFTDVDCPYCHKLHAQLATILAAGIRVRYAFFPRAGLNTPSYQKAVHAWCNQQKPDELSSMMQGKTPEKLMTCANPIEQHVDLASRLGLQGTPSILLENGTLIPGLPPVAELIKLGHL